MSHGPWARSYWRGDGVDVVDRGVLDVQPSGAVGPVDEAMDVAVDERVAVAEPPVEVGDPGDDDGQRAELGGPGVVEVELGPHQAVLAGLGAGWRRTRSGPRARSTLPKRSRWVEERAGRDDPVVGVGDDRPLARSVAATALEQVADGGALVRVEDLGVQGRRSPRGRRASPRAAVKPSGSPVMGRNVGQPPVPGRRDYRGQQGDARRPRSAGPGGGGPSGSSSSTS